jgi:hypothetical protein
VHGRVQETKRKEENRKKVRKKQTEKAVKPARRK